MLVPIPINLDTVNRLYSLDLDSQGMEAFLAARREMQSWILLQLESSSLRKPDDFLAPSVVSPTGEHLPAALGRLKKDEQVASRLAHLLPDVASVSVDVDERRQLKTLYLETTGGIKHEARSLSDGTLRFLALSIIGLDTERNGVICLEEPENGIHPARIPAIVELLRWMAVDTEETAGEDNPLRQIIVNTHSPLVIQRLPLEDIIVLQAYKRDGATLSTFSPVVGTWRARLAQDSSHAVKPVAFGALMAYLAQDDTVEPGIAGKLNALQEFKHQLQLTLG